MRFRDYAGAMAAGFVVGVALALNAAAVFAPELAGNRGFAVVTLAGLLGGVLLIVWAGPGSPPRGTT